MKVMIPRVRLNPDGGVVETEVVEVGPRTSKKAKLPKLPPAWGGSPLPPAGTALVGILAVGAVAAVYFAAGAGFSEAKAISMARAYIKDPMWSKSDPTGIVHRPYHEYEAYAAAIGQPAFSATTSDGGKTYKVRVRHPWAPATLYVTKEGVRSAL